MPCLSGKYDPAVGLVINVSVFPCGAIDGATPVSLLTTFPALIDTGASATCISLSVAGALALPPVGMRPLISATHAIPVNAYLVDIVLPFGSVGYIVRDTQVVEFSPPQGSPFQILVGRDIICKGALTLSFDGHFTLSL